MTSRCNGDFQPATLLSPASRTLSSQSANTLCYSLPRASVAAWDIQLDKLICHTVCIHLLKQKMCHDFPVISLWLIIWEVNWENLWRTTLFQEVESEHTSFNSSVTPLSTMTLQWLKIRFSFEQAEKSGSFDPSSSLQGSVQKNILFRAFSFYDYTFPSKLRFY